MYVGLESGFDVKNNRTSVEFRLGSVITRTENCELSHSLVCHHASCSVRLYLGPARNLRVCESKFHNNLSNSCGTISI